MVFHRKTGNYSSDFVWCVVGFGFTFGLYTLVTCAKFTAASDTEVKETH